MAKISVELRRRDGHVFVLLGPLEGNRGSHVSKKGEEVTFGGSIFMMRGSPLGVM